MSFFFFSPKYEVTIIRKIKQRGSENISVLLYAFLMAPQPQKGHGVRASRERHNETDEKYGTGFFSSGKK